MICNCNDWEGNMEKINGFIVFGFTHQMKYTGKPFVFCPWCSKKLQEEKEERLEDKIIQENDFKQKIYKECDEEDRRKLEKE